MGYGGLQAGLSLRVALGQEPGVLNRGVLQARPLTAGVAALPADSRARTSRAPRFLT